MLLGLRPKEIKPVFLDLWNRKGCKFPFTQEEFAQWCDEDMPGDVRAIINMDPPRDINGGIILYVASPPRALFVQLLITLKPEVSKMLLREAELYAKKLGLNQMRAICPIRISGRIMRIFKGERVAEMLEKEVSR